MPALTPKNAKEGSSGWFELSRRGLRHHGSVLPSVQW